MRNTSRATGSPAITMACRARITPWKRTSSGITADDVISPDPTSSARAASMTRRASSMSSPKYFNSDGSGAVRPERRKDPRAGEEADRHGDRHIEHSLQWLESCQAQRLRQLDSRRVVEQGQIDLF